MEVLALIEGSHQVLGDLSYNPVVADVLDYRERAKIKSTYLDALPDLIKADNRIHTSLNQTVAATGRLSSSEPNLQNIPTRSALGHRVRTAFTVPAQGDVSQADLQKAQTLRLAGQRPPLPAGPGTNPGLASLVARACEPNPADRWGSAEEFGRALDEWLDAHPAPAGQHPAPADQVERGTTTAASPVTTGPGTSPDVSSHDYVARTIDLKDWTFDKHVAPEPTPKTQPIPQERPVAVAKTLKRTPPQTAPKQEVEAKAAHGTSRYQFDRGFLHPSFARNSENGIVKLTNPAILTTDAVLSTPDDVMAAITAFWQTAGPAQPPVLVIARGANETTLDKLVSLNSRGLPVWAVKAPGYGDRCREMLIDIATVTGGSIFSQVSGAGYSRNASGRIAAGELGRAESVTVSADSTSIYGGAGSEDAIKRRLAAIRHEIDTTPSDYDREKLNERLNALVGRVASDTVNAGTAGSAEEDEGRPPHPVAKPHEQLKAFVDKVAERASNQPALWMPELSCYQVQSTARVGLWTMRAFFLIRRDDNATVASFDSFSRACARWVQSNKEFNNNMVAYPVLLQAHARHDVVAYAKRAYPWSNQTIVGIPVLPTVVDLSTGDMHFMEETPVGGRSMWKDIRKAAVETLREGTI